MGGRFRDGSPEVLFHKLKRKHRNAVDSLLARHGLSNIGQPAVLSILSQQPDGTIDSQKVLAEKLNISPATLTVSLKSMERGGYVKRLSAKYDLRRKPVCITEKGLEASRQIDTVFESLDHSMYRGFTPEELAQISEFYRRMIDNLEAAVEEQE